MLKYTVVQSNIGLQPSDFIGSRVGSAHPRSRTEPNRVLIPPALLVSWFAMDVLMQETKDWEWRWLPEGAELWPCVEEEYKDGVLRKTYVAPDDETRLDILLSWVTGLRHQVREVRILAPLVGEGRPIWNFHSVRGPARIQWDYQWGGGIESKHFFMCGVRLGEKEWTEKYFSREETK